uniref:Uncharacterized protein n=1 Tax=Arundo donax TaxID=35708 RepID=A0A0A8Z9G6_ARUDO
MGRLRQWRRAGVPTTWRRCCQTVRRRRCWCAGWLQGG